MFNRSDITGRYIYPNTGTVKYFNWIKLFFNKFGDILITAAIPAYLILIIESIQRNSVNRAWAWIMEKPDAFFVNYLLIALLYLLINQLVGFMRGAYIVSIVLVLPLAIINYYKQAMRNEPLLPWDFKSTGEFMNIAGGLKVSIQATIVLVVMLSFAIIWLIPMHKVFTKKRVIRICSIVLLPVIIGVYLNFVIFNNNVLSNFGVYITLWNQENSYSINGFSLAFTNNIKRMDVKKPDGYSESEMKALAGDIDNLKSSGLQPVEKKPNIVFIMSESFWDPTLLKGVNFSEDPLKTVHSLQDSAITGWLRSPQYGGGTANVEFEALTGYSTSFLPSDTIAYQSNVSRKIGSIIGFLHDKGYYTKAIHPYVRSFWNREKVYEDMGFDEFLSEEAFAGKEIKGPYYSDAAVVEKFKEEYEKRDKNKPIFTFIVTMENHVPYTKEKFNGEESIKVQYNSSLTQEENEMLQAYAEGAKDADQLLGQMVSYFENSNEPTIIVFWGDHLPSLGTNFSIYKKLGFIANSEKVSREDLEKLYRVPVVIWDNYVHKKDKIDGMGTNFISPYVLEKYSLDTPAFYDFLNNLKKSVPAVTMTSDNVTGIQKKLIDEYEMLQYDDLIGKRFVSEKVYSSN